MTQRNTDWPKLFIEKNTGWRQEFATPYKITFIPHQPDKLLQIDAVTIDRTETGFDCTVITGKGYRAQQIEDEYKRLGGSPRDISNVVLIENPRIRIFINRNSVEVGKVLLALNSYHAFDDNTKAMLLGFIGLADFPAPTPMVQERSGCTIL